MIIMYGCFPPTGGMEEGTREEVLKYLQVNGASHPAAILDGAIAAFESLEKQGITYLEVGRGLEEDTNNFGFSLMF